MADDKKLEQLRRKLERAQLEKAVLAERSRLLAEQAADAKHREDDDQHVITELLDRQRELNYMLHRANSVLHHIQQASSALSSEFTELVKELPDPQSPDWDARVAKINELFQKTGELADDVQAAVFGGTDLDEPEPLKRAPEASKAEAAAPPVEEAIPAPPPTLEETAVSPPAVEEEPEAIETAAEVAVQSEAEAEPEPEPVPVTAVEAEAPVPEETQPVQDAEFTNVPPNEKVERLFSGLEPAAAASPEAAKVGLFARIWRKVTRKNARNGSKEVEEPALDVVEVEAPEEPIALDQPQAVLEEPEAIVANEATPEPEEQPEQYIENSKVGEPYILDQPEQPETVLDEEPGVGEPYAVEQPEFDVEFADSTREPKPIEQPEPLVEEPEAQEAKDQPVWILSEGTGEPKPIVYEPKEPEDGEPESEPDWLLDNSTLQPEPEPEVSPEPVAAFDEEPVVAEEPAAIEEPSEPQVETHQEESKMDENTTACVDIFEEVGSELESIQLDVADQHEDVLAPTAEAEETPEPLPVPAEEPVRERKSSVWCRVKSTVSDAVDKRSESAVERAANRNKRRLNRRVSRPRQQPQA